MHEIRIPQSVVDRVVARRGSAHPFRDMDPARTALIVVDLQNGFMMDGVGHAVCPTAREIVPNVNRLAEAVRATGGTVVWIRNTHYEECLTSWSVMHDYAAPDRREHRIRSMSEGMLGNELWAGLDVRPGDLEVRKTRFSAFIQGSSELDRILRGLGIDTVLITGTVTNVCCESTARDAMMLNYKTVMVTDANAAANDEEHNASLIAFYLTFGDILSTDETIACLNANASLKTAAE